MKQKWKNDNKDNDYNYHNYTIDDILEAAVITIVIIVI